MTRARKTKKDKKTLKTRKGEHMAEENYRRLRCKKINKCSIVGKT